MSSTDQKTQLIARFKGHVQGVGFRFTTVRAANGFDITGYVRNLPDGTVECLAEGDQDEVRQFLGEIKDRMQGYIHEVKTQTAPFSGRYDSFDVKY